MISKKGTFYLGVFIFLIPFLGFPTIWKMILVGIAGFSLVVYSIRFPVPRKPLKIKSKKDTHEEVVFSHIKSDKPEAIVIVPEIERVNNVEEKIVQPLPPITKIVPTTKRVRKTTKNSDKIKKVKVKE